MIIVTVKDNSISITGHACRKEPSGIDRRVRLYQLLHVV